jgi:hypothetical protein
LAVQLVQRTSYPAVIADNLHELPQRLHF